MSTNKARAMCLDKRTDKPRWAIEDIYVLKYGSIRTTNNNSHTLIQTFTYKKGKLLSKPPQDRIEGLKRRSLNGEVFHTFSITESKRRIKENGIDRRCGAFKIPAGALYWTSDDSKEFGTTDVEYLGNTKEVLNLTTQQ